MSKKTKEPPKEGKPPGNIKFPNPLLSREANQVCLALAWLSLLFKNLRSRSKRLYNKFLALGFGCVQERVLGF
jgi:hypothetical protein